MVVAVPSGELPSALSWKSWYWYCGRQAACAVLPRAVRVEVPCARQHGLPRQYCSRVAEIRTVFTCELPRTLVQLPT